MGRRPSMELFVNAVNLLQVGRICVHTYKYMYIYMYTCIYMYLYIYMYTCIYMYIEYITYIQIYWRYVAFGPIFCQLLIFFAITPRWNEIYDHVPT